MKKKIVYYVEGDCEKRLLDIYKTNPHNIFVPGKVYVFNFINKIITLDRLSALSRNSTIILVYDTDVANTSNLEANIKILKDHGFHDIIHIQSIKTFEDELVYATSIRNINEIFNTESDNEFKSKFLRISKDSIASRLKKLNFNEELIWSRKTSDPIFYKYHSKEKQRMIKQKKSHEKAQTKTERESP